MADEAEQWTETELDGDEPFTATYGPDGEPVTITVAVAVDLREPDGYGGWAMCDVRFDVEQGYARFASIETNHCDAVPVWALAAVPAAVAAIRDQFVLDGVRDYQRQLRDLFAGDGGEA